MKPKLIYCGFWLVGININSHNIDETYFTYNKIGILLGRWGMLYCKINVIVCWKTQPSGYFIRITK